MQKFAWTFHSIVHMEFSNSSNEFAANLNIKSITFFTRPVLQSLQTQSMSQSCFEAPYLIVFDPSFDVTYKILPEYIIFFIWMDLSNSTTEELCDVVWKEHTIVYRQRLKNYYKTFNILKCICLLLPALFFLYKL